MTTKFKVINLETDKQLIVEEFERSEVNNPYRVVHRVTLSGMIDKFDEMRDPSVDGDSCICYVHTNNFFRVRG